MPDLPQPPVENDARPRKEPPVSAHGAAEGHSFDVGAALALSVAVALLLGLVGYAHWVSRQSEESARWVAHTHEVLGTIRAPYTELREAQSVMRGYVVTGEETFLVPYAQRWVVAAQAIAKLRRLMVDPAQLRRVNALEPHVAAVREFFDERIGQRRELGFDVVRASILSGEGEQRLARVRAVTDELEAAENMLLATRAAEMARINRQSRWADLLLFPMVLLLGGWGFHRLRREAAHRQATLRQQAVIEAAPNGMVMVDEAGRIALVNAQAERLFGYARAELLDQPIEMLIPERFRPGHSALRAGYITVPHARTMGAGRDLAGKRKDGSCFPVEIGLNPIHTPEGVFVLASVIDITERKHAEEALRASEERFRLVVEASPNAKLIVDAAGRITLVNAQVEQLFGYPRAELLGQPMEILVPARYRAAHPGHRAGFMAAPHARSMGAGRDLTGLRKDGSEVPIEIGLNPIHTPEGVLVLASFIDITERKAAEDRLKAHLHEKEVLLQEIHHRVKNNLQVVSSLIGLQADAVQHPEARQALADSRNRIQAIARVHEHLYQSTDLASLDFTTYLRELAVEVFHLYQPTHGSRIQLGFDVEEVRLDINQAIPCALITNELLVNALKYAFPGERSGLVTLTLQHAPGGRVRLAVADDGVGLPPGFDWRAPASLGLELVQTLARQIRADVAVETSLGTRFDLTFPLSTVKLTKPT